MKLARIDHSRCDEYSGTTFVWVEDGMTEERLEEAVQRASEAYLKAASEHMAGEKPEHVFQPDWQANRDRLVEYVLRAHKEAQEKYAEWDKKRREAWRGFDSFLCEEEGITGFWDRDPDITAKVYWGHRHGQDIDKGETEWPRFRLLKKTRQANPGRPVMMITEEDEWL
jgi:hypothetical protein